MDLPGVSSTRRGEGAREEETRVFTEHVRVLEAGEPLAEREIEEVWTALRAALRGEIRRRGLWESPPAYLGIYGWERWGPPGRSPLARGEEGALEELTAECYSYVFVSRLRSLAAQRKVKPNVDGLVFLNIRHFLHERQREHDPIGAQVFAVLQAAVRKAVEAGDLVVISGDAKVRNDTVLGFAPGLRAQPIAREAVAPLVVRWNDDLLPDLLTARGHRQEEVVERVHAHLLALRRQGVGVLRFKDLVDPLKADVRARWAALLAREQGELGVEPRGERPEEVERVRIVQPDRRFEQRQVFRKLVACVLASLERLEVSERTRAYLVTLWQFVRIQASEGMEASPGSLAESMTGLAAGDEDHPSLRSISEQLRIPRERLAGLYQTLGELLARCREAISGETAVKALEGRSYLKPRSSRFHEQ